jgi:hypothetical protein
MHGPHKKSEENNLSSKVLATCAGEFDDFGLEEYET